MVLIGANGVADKADFIDADGNYRLDVRVVVEKGEVPLNMREEKNFYPSMLGYILDKVFHSSFEKGSSEIIVITDSIPVRKKRHIIEKSIKQPLHFKFVYMGLYNAKSPIF